MNAHETPQGPQKPRILNEATNPYEVGVTPPPAQPELTHAQALALVAKYEAALRVIITNDKTHYQHHEPRPYDGRRPTGFALGAGTIFLTPREVAQNALRYARQEVIEEAE